MTVRIKLFDDNDSTTVPPLYWMNYAQQFIHQDRWEKMHLDLVKYNAAFIFENPTNNGGARYLDFDTEKDFVMFALRWS